MNLSIWMFNDIVTVMNKENVFWLSRSNLNNSIDFLIKTDVKQSCSQKRMNTKWGFYKMKSLTNFHASLKDVPMGCKDAVLNEPLLKKLKINCLVFEEKQGNHITITCAFFVLLLSTWRELSDWKDKIQIYSIFSSIKGMYWAPISSKESLWKIVLLLKIS